MRLKGVYTAIVTPFDRSGKICLVALEKLIEIQIEAGIDGLVVNGTTGESPSLTSTEFKLLVAKTVELVNGRCLTVAGTGSNLTQKSIELSKEAISLGVDLVMLITPYYNKPSQKGMAMHFAAIAESIAPFPMIIYNVPSRTSLSINVKTVQNLANSHSNIIGIKDASGDFTQLIDMKRLLPVEFNVLCGEDGLLLPYLSCGASGVVSVISNVIPKETIRLFENYKAKRNEEALRLQVVISPLVKALFLETNPIPVKYALNKIGINVGKPRLPLHELSEEFREELTNCLKKFQ